MLDEQEFEMVRPVHAPVFYGWLMSEKYRRSVIGLEQVIPNATALVSCGGSGMDAHFLAAGGARVISIDISVGAALRAARRAKHFGLPILSIVADAEYLPLSDLSVDLAYVHDGLHHLEKPETAIAEMARVARHGLSITEPARAVATMIAVKLGAAEAVEESGNHVRRFQLKEIQDLLRTLCFETVSPHRYVMWYRHAPGHVVRLLSRPGLRQLGTAGFTIANYIIGSRGNKLAVQARRIGGQENT
jgi:ubiquinone/menaquinone biosynthesis C-methylase UbiE